MSLPTNFTPRHPLSELVASSRRPALTLMCLCIVVLSGCESTPYISQPPTRTSTPAAVESNADAMVRRAKQAQGNGAGQLWLAAANALAREARVTDAVNALSNVRLETLDAAASFDYQALSTELAMARMDPRTAQAWFAKLTPQRPTEQARYKRIADALRTMDVDPASAASALMRAPLERRANASKARNNQIWSLISQTPAAKVSTLATTTGGVERGWWQLKELQLNAFTVAEARTNLTRSTPRVLLCLS